MHELVTERTLEAPAGLIRARAECAGGKVQQVTFRNVPAFAVHPDKVVEVPQLGPVKVDVAYGGMFYVLSEAAPLGLRLTPDEGRDIVWISEMIKAAVQEQLPVVHPTQSEFHGVTIALLWALPINPTAHARNAVTVSTRKLDWTRPATWTGVIDRSPCGTGTCARMATLHARGQLPLNEEFRHEGILGTIFTGRLVEETQVGPYRAVIPTFGGRLGLQASAITCLGTMIPSPKDSRWETFGDRGM
jgi:proline racemase